MRRGPSSWVGSQKVVGGVPEKSIYCIQGAHPRGRGANTAPGRSGGRGRGGGRGGAWRRGGGGTGVLRSARVARRDARAPMAPGPRGGRGRGARLSASAATGAAPRGAGLLGALPTGRKRLGGRDTGLGGAPLGRAPGARSPLGAGALAAGPMAAEALRPPLVGGLALRPAPVPHFPRRVPRIPPKLGTSPARATSPRATSRRATRPSKPCDESHVARRVPLRRRRTGPQRGARPRSFVVGTSRPKGGSGLEPTTSTSRPRASDH